MIENSHFRKGTLISSSCTACVIFWCTFSPILLIRCVKKRNVSTEMYSFESQKSIWCSISSLVVVISIQFSKLLVYKMLFFFYWVESFSQIFVCRLTAHVEAKQTFDVPERWKMSSISPSSTLSFYPLLHARKHRFLKHYGEKLNVNLRFLRKRKMCS